MSFLYPNVLWLLLLPALLSVAALVLRRNRGQAWRKLVSAAHVDALVVRRPLWNRVLPAVLALLAMGCIILALARPINGYRETSATDSGRNLLIALLAKALSARSAPDLPSTRGFGVRLQELDEIHQTQMASVLLSTGGLKLLIYKKKKKKEKKRGIRGGWLFIPYFNF